MTSRMTRRPARGVVGPDLRPWSEEADADRPHDLQHRGVPARGGLGDGPGGHCLPRLGDLLNQGRCHLGPAGAVNAAEDYAVHRCSLRQSSNRKVVPAVPSAMPNLAL